MKVATTAAAAKSAAAAPVSSDQIEVPRGDTAGAMMTLNDVRVTVGDRDLLVGANLRVVGLMPIPPARKKNKLFFCP